MMFHFEILLDLLTQFLKDKKYPENIMKNFKKSVSVQTKVKFCRDFSAQPPKHSAVICFLHTKEEVELKVKN